MRIDRRSLSALLLTGVALPMRAEAAEPLVAITAIVEHPALDACRDGIITGLKQAGATAETSYQRARRASLPPRSRSPEASSASSRR